MTGRRTLVFALALLAAPAAAQQATPTVTLEEAIGLALQAQPGVVRAQGDLRNANATQREMLGNWLPSLSFSASGSRSFTAGEDRVDLNTGQVIQGDRSSNNVNTNLSASYDLFTGFRRGAERRAANAGFDAAEAGLVDARAQVVLQTTQEFLNALAARELLRVREASVRRAEEQLKVSVAKLQQGSATRSDSLRSFVTLGQAQLALLEAEASLTSAEANLGRLIGVTGRVTAQDDPTLLGPAQMLDTAGLRREAVDRSPQVQAAQAQVTSARANLSASRSSYWPTLSLSGSLGYSGGAQVGDPVVLREGRSVTLRASYPIFNGFTRETQVVQRSSALDAAEATAEDTRRQVGAALTTQLADLTSAERRITITRASVVAAEEDLRVQQERYRLGAATIIDVLTSQVTLNEAEVDVVTARFAYLRARAQIEALIGRPL